MIQRISACVEGVISTGIVGKIMNLTSKAASAHGNLQLASRNGLHTVSNTSAPMQPELERQDEWSLLLQKIGKERCRIAYTSVFRHFAPLVKGYCLSLPSFSLPPESADELVQQVMLKVWQKAPLFNPQKAAASTWIFTIARNCRIDMLRRGNRTEQVSLTDTSDFEQQLSAEDIWRDDQQSEPFTRLVNHRQKDAIRESLKHLPAEQCHILTKVYMEGKSHSEISAEMDLPLGTVKSRLRLALQKLKVLWGVDNG